MFNSENGYSLADIAAATGASRGGYGNDGLFGGGYGGWWIILLFLFAFGGWGNGGWGNGGGGAGPNAATAIYGLDSLGTTRTGFYDLNTGMLNGFADTTAAVTAGTAAIQSDISALGLQSCQNTNAITNAITSGTMANM
jgi:hypothetical protein